MENPAAALAPPKRWERYTLLVLLLGILLFGVLVEIRSAFLTRRMGDFGCYARGAWAVRTGADLYDVTCDNDWHYNYPPLLAILLAPLADPPRGADDAGMTPYAVSVAVWPTVSGSGVWLSRYEYFSSGRDDAFVGQHYVVVLQHGDRLTLRSLPNSAGSQLTMDLTVDGNVMTGTWVEQTAPKGYYRGARYHGAIQLLAEPRKSQTSPRFWRRSCR